MRNLSFILLVIAFSFYSLAGGRKIPEKKADYILLKRGSIVDVMSGKTMVGDILIKNERIETISYDGSISEPKGVITYDLTGKFVIPGLIDGHVHITHGTYKEAVDHLGTALKYGVTGVRDMGGDGRMLTLLKKNMMVGENSGSDIYFSTIIAGPEFFVKDPRPQSVAAGAKAGKVSWQRELEDSTDCRQIVAEAKGMGATAIKIYTEVKGELIKKISDEAKKQGLKIWGHAAIPPSRPHEVIEGGVETISHAGDWLQYELIDKMRDRYSFKSRKEAMAYRKKLMTLPWTISTPKVKKIFDLMKKKNCIMDATLFVYHVGLKRKGGAGKIAEARYKYAMKTVKEAYKYGVKICAGSDHMISPENYRNPINIHKELELLSEAGMSNIDVLRSATIVNAEVVGDEKNTGSISKGKLANIVVLNKDPLKKISNTRDIKYVIKRGKHIL